MRILFLLALGAGSAFAAAPRFTVSPQISNLTHNGARFLWETDVTSSSKIVWDTISHPVGRSASYPNYNTSPDVPKIHQIYVAGLLANTTYFYRGCSFASSDNAEACSLEATFTTLPLPSPHPALAVLPISTVNTTMPIQTGETVTVGADCDDAVTGLMALWTAANWGDTIIVPATTICSGSYKFPGKAADGTGPADPAHRWIIVKSAGADSLPAGKRVSPSDVPSMARFEQTHWGHGAGTTTAECIPGAYHWELTQGTPGWYMKKCDVVASGAVSAATGAQGSGDEVTQFRLAAPLAVLPIVGQIGYSTGVGGIAKANGTFHITAVTDASRFEATYYNGYIDPSNTYTGGGSVVIYDWVPVPHQNYTGAAPVAPCTTGEWSYNNTGAIANFTSSYTDPNYSVGRVFRCVAANTWKHHWIVFNQIAAKVNPNDAPIFDLTLVHHIRFIGLEITNPPVPDDVLLRRTGPGMYAAGTTQSGATPAHFIYQFSSTHHIVWDRCYIHSEWPAKNQILLYFHGDNVAIVDSYFYAMGMWFGSDEYGPYLDNLAGDKIGAQWGGPKLLDNNYLEGYGITVHFNDQSSGDGIPVHDVTVKRNWFYRDPAKFLGGALATVDYYIPLRQLLELKSGIRFDVNGNIFENNFQNVSQAAAIMLSPVNMTQLASICDITATSGGTTTFQCRSPLFAQVGDWVSTIVTGTLHQVLAVPGTDQVTIAGTGFVSGDWFVNHSQPAGIFDITVRNNTFKNLPTALGGYSHGNLATFDTYSEDRVSIVNNLFVNLGPGSNKVPKGGWQTSGGAGYMFTQWGGHSDTVVNHNTIYEFVKSTIPDYAPNATVIVLVPTFQTHSSALENEGFTFTNNLMYTSNDVHPLNDASGLRQGTAWLNAFMGGTVPYNVTKNVVLRRGGDPTGYPAGGKWVDSSSISASTIFNNLTADFTLKSNYRAEDTCFSAPGDCTTDATDSGVNMATLLAAQSNDNVPSGGASGAPGAETFG